MEQAKLKSIIESVLFMHGEPVKITRLQKIAAAPKPEVENAIMLLSGEYASQKKGLRIIQKDGQVQMVTAPDNAAYVQQLIEGELQEALSNASLEVLSVVAYRGPMARSEIEAIRGVNCSYTLRSLLMRGLIERSDNPKDARGYVYAISFEFLKKLGLDNIKSLPDYDNLSNDSRIDDVVSSSQISKATDQRADNGDRKPVSDNQQPANDNNSPSNSNGQAAAENHVPPADNRQSGQ